MTALSDFHRLTDQEWRVRHESEHGMFVAEGLTTIERALAEGFVLRNVLSSPKWIPELSDLGIPRSRILEHTDDEVTRVTGFHVHRGALASFERPRLPEVQQLLSDARRIVMTEGIVDHANIGAIMRAAAAFSIDAVVLSEQCADPLYRRAIKVSMGTVFKVPWTRTQHGIDVANSLGFHTVALTPAADALDLQSLPDDVRAGRVALLLGSEGSGLSAGTLRTARHRARIPIARGVDSLNVGAACAIACYELTR